MCTGPSVGLETPPSNQSSTSSPYSPHTFGVRMSVRAHERGCACTRVRMRPQASARAHVCTGTRGRERARQGTHDKRSRVTVWRYGGAERIVEWHLPELRQDDGVNLRLR